ncbi:MAG: hypothetical protein Q4F65_14135 [Propionibacteriaceae bacterium]|nr:hypothetical protein [Propionibacteriaceae bacterium]
MKRPAFLVLTAVIPMLALGGCSAPDATGPAPAPSTIAATDPTPTTPDGPNTATPSTETPVALPTIPAEPVPGEVVRSTFGPTTTIGRAEHDFGGRTVSYHVLCSTHEGEVEVELWADGREVVGSANACSEPFFTVEDTSFGSGTTQVELRVQPSGGAEGLVYVVDGEI